MYRTGERHVWSSILRAPRTPGLLLTTLGLSIAARSFFRTVLAHPKVLLNLLRTAFTRCPCRRGNPFDGHQSSAAIWKATRWCPVAVLSGPRALAQKLNPTSC